VRTAGGTGPKLAVRARNLEVSPTVAMAARARALKAKGVRVLDFTVGEPDQPTPRHVVEAGKAAIDAGRTKYAPASGLPELRAAVAERYLQDFRVSFAPEEVTVAVGGKQALALLYQAILDRGSEVIVPIPAWPTFAEAARVAGGTPVFVKLRVQATGGSPVTLLLDTLTCLPARIVRSTGGRTETLHLRDWRTVSGIKLPVVIRRSASDSTRCASRRSRITAVARWGGSPPWSGC